MNEQKQYVCPWCGGKDVVEGIQSTYAKVQPKKKTLATLIVAKKKKGW